jgi:hypothetical protein
MSKKPTQATINKANDCLASIKHLHDNGGSWEEALHYRAKLGDLIDWQNQVFLGHIRDEADKMLDAMKKDRLPPPQLAPEAPESPPSN